MDSGDLPALRIGVAIGGAAVQAWQADCIERLRSSPVIAFAGIVRIEGETAVAPIAPLFRSSAQTLVPCPPSGVAVDADVVLDFSGGAAAALADRLAARIWRFRFGDGASSAPPGFWECDGGEPVARAALEEFDARGFRRALVCGAVATTLRSPAETAGRILAEAASWPEIAARRAALPDDARPAALAERSRGVPSRWQELGLAAKIAVRRLRHSFDLFFADKWNVGLAADPIERFAHGGSLGDVDWLEEAAGLDYRADPFGAVADGRRIVLVEYFDASAGRGRIEATQRDGDRWSGAFETVLAADQHLSYPYLIADGDALYLAPERFGSASIALYRSSSLPRDWHVAAEIADGVAAVDATIFPHEGRWWLLFTGADEPRHHRLYAYYADSLVGPYRAHPRNPVKIDPRSAGCAGTPFVVDGVLYRPSQDCSRTYGGAIVMNRVVALTPLEFVEEDAGRIEPSRRYPNGVHTLSRIGDRTLVDGKRRAFTLRRVLWRLSRRRHRRAT